MKLLAKNDVGMEFFETIKERRSIRKFKDKGVEIEKLRKLLEAVNSAPSAGNLQSYEVILVKDPGRKEKLSYAAYGQSSIREAPIVLVFCTNPRRARRYGKRGEELYCIQDATIAASYAQLAATALGLGSVWIGAFDEEEVRIIIEAPDEVRPVAIIPIGYPAEKPFKTPRRKINDIVHEEVY
jgi:nitroreductase